jgi:hypothetical protein
MTLQHTNRRGKIFYINQGVTTTGKPKYYFSSNSEGNLINEVPEGFEVYENPNAQVFLRKIQPKIITDEEVAVVDNGMKKFTQLKYYLIDVKKNTIILFLSNQNPVNLSEIFQSYHKFDAIDIPSVLPKYLDYSPLMQFVLIDENKRIFNPQRYCFRGSVDDWIDIGESGKLPELVKTYLKHLEQDSFYDLF